MLSVFKKAYGSWRLQIQKSMIIVSVTSDWQHRYRNNTLNTCAFVYVSWQWGKRQRRWYVSKFKCYLRQWRLEGRGRVRFWCISYLCFSFVFQYHLEGNYSISEISCEQFKTHFQVSSVTPEILGLLFYTLHNILFICCITLPLVFV